MDKKEIYEQIKDKIGFEFVEEFESTSDEWANFYNKELDCNASFYTGQLKDDKTCNAIIQFLNMENNKRRKERGCV